MKKYALLAGLTLVVIVSSCTKGELEVDIQDTDVELYNATSSHDSMNNIRSWDKTKLKDSEETTNGDN